MQAGAILPAARLLNDQAAVYMRLGDPVRATYLLSQAHERFEHHLRQHPEDAMARRTGRDQTPAGPAAPARPGTSWT